MLEYFIWLFAKFVTRLVHIHIFLGFVFSSFVGCCRAVTLRRRICVFNVQQSHWKPICWVDLLANKNLDSGTRRTIRTLCVCAVLFVIVSMRFLFSHRVNYGPSNNEQQRFIRLEINAKSLQSQNSIDTLCISTLHASKPYTTVFSFSRGIRIKAMFGWHHSDGSQN